jgi:tetratricopeptide (TPR) repeat protein
MAAVAAFGAFWAALLVTVGFPLLLVAGLYVALVAGLALASEGRRTFSALAPRARQVGRDLADGGRAIRGRVDGIDWSPLRTRLDRVTTASAARTGAVRRRLADARSQHSARAEAQRLNAEAATLRQRGELDAALEAGERALELVRGLGDRHAEALTLNGLGLTQARLGDEAAAVDSYEAAVAILTELGDLHGAGRVLANLGALHLDLGHADEARARWVDALERLEPGSPEHERTAEQLRKTA